jgi:hypothetical protein
MADLIPSPLPEPAPTPAPAPAPPLRSVLRRYAVFAVVCGLLAYLAFPTGGGVIAVLAVPVALLWLVVCIVQWFRKPPLRRDIAVKVAVLTMLLVSLFAWHQAQQEARKQRAAHYATLIEAFHAKQGRYPNTLAEAGAPDAPPASQSRIHYVAPAPDSNAPPSLFYVHAFVFRAAVRYDFAKRAWVFDGN